MACLFIAVLGGEDYLDHYASISVMAAQFHVQSIYEYQTFLTVQMCLGTYFTKMDGGMDWK